MGGTGTMNLIAGQKIRGRDKFSPDHPDVVVPRDTRLGTEMRGTRHSRPKPIYESNSHAVRMASEFKIKI